MILIGIALIILGGVFLFAALTGTPRAVLGVGKGTAPSPTDSLPAQGHNPSPTPPGNPLPENLQSDMSASTDPDDQSPPSDTPESVPTAPSDISPVTPAPAYTTPEIPASRRISSAILGVIGVAFGILALLDSV